MLLKQLLLRNCAVDIVEICNFYVGRMIIKAAKRIFNSGKICHSYSDLNFGVTFLGTQCRKKCNKENKIDYIKNICSGVENVLMHFVNTAGVGVGDGRGVRTPLS